MAQQNSKNTSAEEVIIPQSGYSAVFTDEDSDLAIKKADGTSKKIGGVTPLPVLTLAEVLALTDVAEGTQYIVSDYQPGARSLFIYTGGNWRYTNLDMYSVPAP